jgi:KDO2-lipid IV(A) lauroyltransferase
LKDFSYKKIKRSVRSRLIIAATNSLSHLPLGVALRLGTIAGQVGYRLSRRYRDMALKHLAQAFPEKSQEERRRIALASFVHLGQAAMEVLVIRHIDPQLETYVQFSEESLNLMRRLTQEGRGFVCATGHMGNWELLARRFGRDGLRPAVIARRSREKGVDELAANFRSSGGVTTLWREDPSLARGLLRTMREGRPLGILIDVDTNVQGVFVPFFGRLAHTPRAAADLALRFGTPLVVGWTRRQGQGRPGYIVEFEPVPFDMNADRESEVVRVTAACTARLERTIRENPTEWSWMTPRWKTRPEGEAERDGS